MSITLTKISISLLFIASIIPDSPRTLGRQCSYKFPSPFFFSLDLAAAWLCSRLPGSSLHCPSLSTHSLGKNRVFLSRTQCSVHASWLGSRHCNHLSPSLWDWQLTAHALSHCFIILTLIIRVITPSAFWQRPLLASSQVDYYLGGLMIQINLDLVMAQAHQCYW